MGRLLCDILVERGVITESQRDRALLLQQSRARPIGAILEESLGVDPRAVEQAWAQQMAEVTQRVDPHDLCPTPEALASVSARQAWQFGLMPVRFESVARVRTLVACSSPRLLPRAMRFVLRRLRCGCQFLLADESELGLALQRNYPMPGLGPQYAGALNTSFDFPSSILAVQPEAAHADAG